MYMYVKSVDPTLWSYLVHVPTRVMATSFFLHDSFKNFTTKFIKRTFPCIFLSKIKTNPILITTLIQAFFYPNFLFPNHLKNYCTSPNVLYQNLFPILYISKLNRLQYCLGKIDTEIVKKWYFKNKVIFAFSIHKNRLAQNTKRPNVL